MFPSHDHIVKGSNHRTMKVEVLLDTDDGPRIMDFMVSQQACDEIIQLLRKHDWFNG